MTSQHKRERRYVILYSLILAQPYPPPRSCILVHKKSLCCPYLSCSKYHINFYKNSERNHEHLNRLQVSHEKTLEKSSRTDDGGEEANGGERNETNKNNVRRTRKINKNIKPFQVASKVEVCTHQVNETRYIIA